MGFENVFHSEVVNSENNNIFLFSVRHSKNISERLGVRNTHLNCFRKTAVLVERRKSNDRVKHFSKNAYDRLGACHPVPHIKIRWVEL